MLVADYFPAAGWPIDTITIQTGNNRQKTSIYTTEHLQIQSQTLFGQLSFSHLSGRNASPNARAQWLMKNMPQHGKRDNYTAKVIQQILA
jgi:hypothetical protein